VGGKGEFGKTFFLRRVLRFYYFLERALKGGNSVSYTIAREAAEGRACEEEIKNYSKVGQG